MDKGEYLRLKAKEAGFDSIEDYVRANLHLLPKQKQALFKTVFDNTNTHNKNYEASYVGKN